MLLKSTSQQVNFTESLLLVFLFFCFDVEHGASFFSGNFLKIEVLNQD